MPSGNPMALVFLVQGCFMTSRLDGVASSYGDMMGGFAMFNLEMAPPSWAKGLVMSVGEERRRVGIFGMDEVCNSELS